MLQAAAWSSGLAVPRRGLQQQRRTDLGLRPPGPSAVSAAEHSRGGLRGAVPRVVRRIDVTLVQPDRPDCWRVRVQRPDVGTASATPRAPCIQEYRRRRPAGILARRPVARHRRRRPAAVEHRDVAVRPRAGQRPRQAGPLSAWSGRGPMRPPAADAGPGTCAGAPRPVRTCSTCPIRRAIRSPAWSTGGAGTASSPPGGDQLIHRDRSRASGGEPRSPACGAAGGRAASPWPPARAGRGTPSCRAGPRSRPGPGCRPRAGGWHRHR